MKRLSLFTAAALLVQTGAVSAASVDGYEDIVDGGSVWTLIFDTAPADVLGNSDGIVFDFLGGLTVTATSTSGTVIQDHQEHGGLGVFGGAGSLDALETASSDAITLTFSEIVDIQGITVNGLLGSGGHTAAADGAFLVETSGSLSLGVNGSIVDGVGKDWSQQGRMCDGGIYADWFCGVSSITFLELEGHSFEGFVESVTISAIAPVPLPAGAVLLLTGLGALAIGRRVLESRTLRGPM